jgi:hypothetical protein
VEEGEEPGRVHYRQEVDTRGRQGRTGLLLVANSSLTRAEPRLRQVDRPGPEALTAEEAASVIGRAAGRAIASRDISSAEMARMLEGAGIQADYLAMLLRDMEAIRGGSGALVTDVVARVSGRPATSFAEYAARAATAWSRS